MPKFGSLHVCRTRITRLDAAGAPVIGASSVYVSDALVTVGISPEIAEGEEREVINGCDCVTLSYRSPDKLKRFTFEVEDGLWEPHALEMMTRAPIIPGASAGTALGNAFPDDTGACVGQPSGVAVEFWTEARDGGQPLAGTPYVHWIFPRSIWRMGDVELSNEFATSALTGYSEPNAAFGDPHNDQPTAYPVAPQGAYFLTATAPPAATPGYAALAAS